MIEYKLTDDDLKERIERLQCEALNAKARGQWRTYREIRKRMLNLQAILYDRMKAA